MTTDKKYTRALWKARHKVVEDWLLSDFDAEIENCPNLSGYKVIRNDSDGVIEVVYTWRGTDESARLVLKQVAQGDPHFKVKKVTPVKLVRKNIASVWDSFTPDERREALEGSGLAAHNNLDYFVTKSWKGLDFYGRWTVNIQAGDVFVDTFVEVEE